MSQLSFWWTTSGSPSGHQVSSYTQAHLATISQILAAASKHEGVAPGFRNELEATVSGANTISINTGGAIVDGKPYSNDSALAVNVPSAVGGGNTRIDKIVLRADWSSFEVEVVRIAGVDAASPSAPAITQSTGVAYDIEICQVTVNTSGTVTVVDERVWAAAKVDDSTIEINDGALRIKDDGVTTAKILDDAVTEDKLAANSVGSSQIKTNAVSSDEIAANAVGSSEIAASAVGSDKIASNAVTSAKIASSAVTSSELASNAVTTAKISDSNVTAAKIASNAVTNAKIATDAVTEHKIDNGAVTQSKIASDAVDDTKVGERVLKVTKRKGGSATNWQTSGSTNYTPTDVKSQVGSVASTSTINAGFTQHIVVAFPESFSQIPLVFVQVADQEYWLEARTTAISTTQFQVSLSNTHASSAVSSGQVVNWLAIGEG